MGCRAFCSARGRDDRTAEQVATGSRGSMFDRDAWLPGVGDTIAEAIQRRDTRHAIFHGCYDWHSAVHAHWALLRIGRVLAAERFVEAATAELTLDRLAT